MNDGCFLCLLNTFFLVSFFFCSCSFVPGCYQAAAFDLCLLHKYLPFVPTVKSITTRTAAPRHQSRVDKKAQCSLHEGVTQRRACGFTGIESDTVCFGLWSQLQSDALTVPLLNGKIPNSIFAKHLGLSERYEEEIQE